MIKRIGPDANEAAGLQTQTQYGVRMPSGKTIWATGDNDGVTIPGVSKGVWTAPEPRRGGLDFWVDLAGAQDLYDQNLRNQGVTVDDSPDAYRLVLIKRTITIIVGETEVVS